MAIDISVPAFLKRLFGGGSRNGQHKLLDLNAVFGNEEEAATALALAELPVGVGIGQDAELVQLLSNPNSSDVDNSWITVDWDSVPESCNTLTSVVIIGDNSASMPDSSCEIDGRTYKLNQACCMLTNESFQWMREEPCKAHRLVTVINFDSIVRPTQSLQTVKNLSQEEFDGPVSKKFTPLIHALVKVTKAQLALSVVARSRYMKFRSVVLVATDGEHNIGYAPPGYWDPSISDGERVIKDFLTHGENALFGIALNRSSQNGLAHLKFPADSILDGRSGEKLKAAFRHASRSSAS